MKSPVRRTEEPTVTIYENTGATVTCIVSAGVCGETNTTSATSHDLMQRQSGGSLHGRPRSSLTAMRLPNQARSDSEPMCLSALPDCQAGGQARTGATRPVPWHGGACLLSPGMDRPLVPAPLARGARGAVVAPHHLASAAGLSILERGGSAVDAAIATNAVLAVVQGNSCGIGGDAFWLVWDPPTHCQYALNGSGRAPAAADPAALSARGFRTLPHHGPLSITVPGAVRSWGDAHKRFGRLPRDVVLERAIELASDGFPAYDGFVASVEATFPSVSREIGPDAGWSAVYRPHDRAWRPGERVRLPALAATLRRMADAGWDDFYDGEIAEKQARGLIAAGSAITADDLRAHTSTWNEPISTAYRGTTVTTHRPNSTGLAALELLNILEQFEPPEAGVFQGGHGADARWVHLGVEAAKLAMADRDAHLTDPGFRDIPIERLLDKGYATALAARVDQRRATPAAASRAPKGGGTIWLGVVDANGMAVSLIESNYAGFGSGIVDPVTGIGYQNRGSYFSLDDDHPNVLAPGKRTLHTLMPGMLFRDGSPWVVVGSMGGDGQPQIHAQVVSSLVDGGVDVATAVAQPRWFAEPEEHFAPPDTVRAEPRFRDGLLEALADMGHPIARARPFDSSLGHCHAIELVDGGPASPDGSVAAATDPRSAGLPAAR
jgi:gamma-glutamyltranspeptidase/glutathione hydrolase